MRFDTLLRLRDIENGWSVDPSSTLDDWCPGTGQNVVRFFFKKLNASDRIQIATKHFNELFYKDIINDFKVAAMQIEAVVLNPNADLSQNAISNTIIDNGGKVFVAPDGSYLRKDLSRFFNVVGAGNCRVCVNSDGEPYLAKSFYNNQFMSRHLSKSFEIMRTSSTELPRRVASKQLAAS